MSHAPALPLTPHDDDGIVVVSRAESVNTVDYRQWPSALRERLGDSAGTALAEVFRERDEALLNVATERFERRLSDECGKLRAEIGELRSDLREQSAALRADFRVGLADVRADFIKWSFVFWVGQAAATAGLVVALR